MEDDEDDPSAPVDLVLNGSDTLPALAQSTNPLFPNAIVKRPTHAHGKVAPKPKPGATATAVAAADEKDKEKEDKEKKGNQSQSVGPSPQTKPYGAKYTPVSPPSTSYLCTDEIELTVVDGPEELDDEIPQEESGS